jgi:putative transposase
MFLQRGLSFTHEAVREWESRLAPLLGETLRKRRHGAVGPSWYVDETYVKVQGQWSYLDRAIDRDGNLVDARLSDTRDLAAAEAFFRSAWTVTGESPDRITTDGHDAYPRAIRNVFGNRVMHRTNRYLNNHLEIVLTQLAKTHVLTPWMRRHHVADFDLITGDDDTIDQQLNQLASLLECGTV